jgi:hypothetical protein
MKPSSSDPVALAFAREIEQGRNLLSIVRQDLVDTAAYLKGDLKVTNHVTRLVQALRKGELGMDNHCEWLRRLITLHNEKARFRGLG